MMMMACQTFGCMSVVENHYRYINPLKLVAIWEEGFVKQQFTIFMWMKRAVLSHLRIHHCPAHNPPIYLLTWWLHLSFFLSLSHLISPHLPWKKTKFNTKCIICLLFEVHFLDMNLSSYLVPNNKLQSLFSLLGHGTIALDPTFGSFTNLWELVSH
jgi:hypothetical protein